MYVKLDISWDYSLTQFDVLNIVSVLNDLFIYRENEYCRTLKIYKWEFVYPQSYFIFHPTLMKMELLYHYYSLIKESCIIFKHIVKCFLPKECLYRSEVFYSVKNLSWLVDPVLYLTCDVMHFSMVFMQWRSWLFSNVLGTENEAVGWDQARGGKRGDNSHTVVGRLIFCKAHKKN